MKLLPQVPKIFAYLTVEFFILKVINSKQDLENEKHFMKSFFMNLVERILELVSKELNHLAAILHVYAVGLNFMK
jgi:hypothetical protein